MGKKPPRLSQARVIALGFFIIIMTGTLLLMLPISSRSGEWTNPLDALFTATSASCVTGLVIADTFRKWTLFGQCVILFMIQVGGLGFMTVGVLFSLVLRRRIGLKERGMLQESVNTLQIGGVVKLAKKIIFGTCIFEGTGAVLLAARFIPELGFARGLYYGVFHSISAFCNAGFDLMGRFSPYSSLTRYYDDWIVNLTIMGLIVIGGIGFIVWDDISKNKLNIKKYHLHTKIVLVTTASLIVGGAVLFYLFERNNLMSDMSVSGKVLSSLFSSVTPRTAGFNTLDTAALTDSSKLLSMILMFIGGSPGSTAGGIKTTTIIVLAVFLRSTLKRSYGCNIFGRRFEDEAIKRASAIFCINLGLSLIAALVITSIQGIPLTDVLFEVFSAIGTVGMSTGITRDLTVVSQIVIILLMYSGRIGSLSFALSFTDRKKVPHIQQPEEKITVG